jgi:CheY-like chemotaxis protein
MQRAGYVVDAVENGIQAFERVRDGQYNAVLMDVQMPVMNGLDVTQKIREWETAHGGHIPIIAMTAHAMQGDRERCLDAGMDDYVSKPLEPRVLYAALDRWIMGEVAREQEGGLPPVPASPAPIDRLEDLPPMNVESALPLVGGDYDFLVEMLGEYRKHLPDRLVEIQEALQAGDSRKIFLAAHALRGISLNLRIDRIAHLLTVVEEAGEKGDLEWAGSTFTLLEPEISRLDEFLKARF